MDKKYLKWSLLGPIVLMGLAILGALAYLLVPVVISTLFATQHSGTSANPCDFSSGVSGPQGQVNGSISGLCQTSETVLGAAIMIIIMLAGVILSLSAFVAIIDIATSSTLKSNDKLIWIVVVFFLGFIGAIAYYLMVRRAQN